MDLVPLVHTSVYENSEARVYGDRSGARKCAREMCMNFGEHVYEKTCMEAIYDKNMRCEVEFSAGFLQ